MLIGTGMGGDETIEAGVETLLNRTATIESVLHADDAGEHGLRHRRDRHRAPGGRIRAGLGLRQPAHAIGEAAEIIRAEADVMLAGGARRR